MDELALVSKRLLASLASTRLVVEDGGASLEVWTRLFEARDLYELMIGAMGASPHLVNDELRAFATSVDQLLTELESSVARRRRPMH